MKALDFLTSFAKIVAFAVCLTQTANANLKHEITMPEATIAVLEFGNDGKLAFTERQKLNFWAKVNKDGPTPQACPHLGACWIWTGCLNGAGYGNFGFRGRTRLSHRLAYLARFGNVPEGKPYLLHQCHTPACVNPLHIHPGTQAENISEMVSAGRYHVRVKVRALPKGSAHGMSKLTEGQVLQIRVRCASGERNCDVARSLMITPTTVGDILSGKTWRHV